MTDRRIPEIDVVRGLALAGLPLVNFMLTVGKDNYPEPGPVSAFVYHDLVYQRFLTIFCFLFGVSFALILQGAAERAHRPRLVLARRLGALVLISMVQAFALDHNLQLAVYAVLGLVVLLPVSYLSPRAQLLVGLGLLVASIPIIETNPEHDGNPVKALIEWSGLLVLGASVVRHRLHTQIAERVGQLRVAFVVSLALTILTNVFRPDPANLGGTALAEVRLLATSAVYVTGLLLLLRTPVRAWLTAALAPLGRMALTCFLTQALAAVVIAAAIGDVHDWNYALLTFGGTEAFVALQAIACTLWLRRFRYGPVEYAWRCATWWTITPAGTGAGRAGAVARRSPPLPTSRRSGRPPA